VLAYPVIPLYRSPDCSKTAVGSPMSPAEEGSSSVARVGVDYRRGVSVGVKVRLGDMYGEGIGKNGLQEVDEG
jgi:hypothetical protein